MNASNRIEKTLLGECNAETSFLCIAAERVGDGRRRRRAVPYSAAAGTPQAPTAPGLPRSRLEIVNEDDRGYAIDVDYRRNRLEFRHRSGGDIFIPGNSSIVLTFDDDWTISGDHETLRIEIRSGRTTTLRLETRRQGRQTGLFATVRSDRGSRTTKQLFRYSDRPGRPGDHTPPPSRPPQKPVAPQPPQPPRGGSQAQPPRGGPQHNGPQAQPPRGGPQGNNHGSSVGKVVGAIVDELVGNDRPGSGHRPGPGAGPGPRR